MKCLSCGEEMTNNLVQTKKDRIAYDICEKCGSLWLDAGELDKTAFQVAGSIEYSSRSEAGGAAEPGRNCPRCEDTVLGKVYFLGESDFLLDRCGNCGGFWLDGGELDLINRELERIMPVAGRGFSDFVNNVHLPYWHKRVRRKSSEAGFKVEVPPVKNAELESESEYECPACGANLNLYRAYGVEIEGCPACKGIWLDRDELRKLKDRCDKVTWRTLRWMDDELDAIENANATPSKRACPKCDGEKLVTASFGDSTIMIDWCPGCHGTWLDRDEFLEIVKHLRSQLDELSPAEMRQKVYEEIKEIWSGPEGEISEILDAKAAISALLSITVFEHPALVKLLFAFRNIQRAMGL